MKPEVCEALYTVAHTFYGQGKYKEASTLFCTMVQEAPRTYKYWIGLGASLQMAKSYDEALLAYETAAMLDPCDPHVHLHAADCFFAKGLPKEALFAVDCAERAVKQQPANLRAPFKEHIALIRKAWSRK